jgi:hypothetical protein
MWTVRAAATSEARVLTGVTRIRYHRQIGIGGFIFVGFALKFYGFLVITAHILCSYTLEANPGKTVGKSSGTFLFDSLDPDLLYVRFTCMISGHKLT